MNWWTFRMMFLKLSLSWISQIIWLVQTPFFLPYRDDSPLFSCKISLSATHTHTHTPGRKKQWINSTDSTACQQPSLLTHLFWGYLSESGSSMVNSLFGKFAPLWLCAFYRYSTHLTSCYWVLAMDQKLFLFGRHKFK